MNKMNGDIPKFGDKSNYYTDRDTTTAGASDLKVSTFWVKHYCLANIYPGHRSDSKYKGSFIWGYPKQPQDSRGNGEPWHSWTRTRQCCIWIY